MLDDRAGFYTKHHDKSFFLHDYYTFTPTPICEINIKLDYELCNLLSSAQRLFGLLEGSCQYINNIEHINSLLLKKEAVMSCSIDDGVNIPYLDLFIPAKQENNRITPVLNCIRALDYGIGELKNVQLSNNLILSVHKVLMEHKSGTEIIGDIRKKQNIIGSKIISVSGIPSYNPPEARELSSCMADIQRFIKKNDAMDILIKAALLHYQIEVVHPFDSGNGKIGRILILMYLLENKILTHTFLPISEFFETHKVEYFDRIKAVHNLGQYEQWIKFFLNAFIVSSDTLIKRIKNAIQLRDNNLTLIRAKGKNTTETEYLIDAYRYIEKNVFLNTAALADSVNVSYNTAAKIIGIFKDLEIIKLIKEQERNKTYLYNDLLEAIGITV